MEDKKERGRKVLLRGPENYEDWAQVIRMRLLAARVWHTVLVEPEESEMKPAQTSATGSKGQRIEATKEWQDSKAEEGKAADIILSSISEEQQKHVRRIEHPHHIWKTLKGIHEQPNNEKLHNVMVQLFSKDLGRTIEERGSRIRVLDAEIESYDSTLKLPEKTLVILLLESLTPEYDTMKKILITTDQIDELDKVLQKLAGEEVRIVKGEVEQALAVRKEGKGRSKGRQDGKDMKCFRCDRTGHRKSECFATRSADGTPLEDEPPVKPRKRGEKARAAPVPTIPRSYEEAVNDSVFGHEWRKATEKELSQLASFKTWRLEDLPAGKNLVSSRWVFDLKKNQQGEVTKFKARLVARGFSQKKGIDYIETFAPTAKYNSLRMLLAVAATEDLEIHQGDVESAYLAADLDKEIFMEPPEGVETRGKVCRVLRGLYGLKQSARLWNRRLTSFLLKHGFRQLSTDFSILTKGGMKEGLTILIYVDDLLFISPHMEQINWVKKLLASEFRIKDLGEAKTILNMQVTRDRKKRQLTLSQPGYTRKVLERFGMTDCHPVATPMEPGAIKVLDRAYKEVKDSPVESKADKTRYQEAIGSLMHLMVSTRPDIAYAVGRLSRYCQNPTEVHWKAAKQVFQYLKGSTERGIRFGKGEGLTGASDSSFADDLIERKSTAAYVFLLNGGAITWASKKTPVVALSSTEAEYMAATAAAREEAWVSRQLAELGIKQTGPTRIDMDNQSTIQMTKNPEFHARTKHIDVQYHYIREQVASDKVQVEYVPSAEMLGDELTKPLSAQARKEKLQGLGLTQ